jgi:hypothetical protein
MQNPSDFTMTNSQAPIPVPAVTPETGRDPRVGDVHDKYVIKQKSAAQR